MTGNRAPARGATFIGFGAVALWSALALYLQCFAPWSPRLLAAAFGLPLLFFLVNDRIVMPSEEAMLRRLHPEAFEAYARRTRRWFGQRRERA